jgi:hypothetical protein
MLELVNNSNQLNNPTTYNNIVIIDSLGTGWNFVSATPLTGSVNTYNTGTHKLSWNITTLAPGDTARLTLVAKATSAGAIRNSAWIETVGGTFIGKEAIEAYVIVASEDAPVAPVITPSNPNICGGGSVLLTATGAVGATSYQWYLNDVEITGAVSSTYTATSGGRYGVSYFNNTCVSQRSADVTVTTGSSLTPSVSVSESENDVCAGTSVTFTATPTNGGSSPGYVWKKNGTVVTGETGSTYGYVPADNDEIVCEMTSSDPCADTTPVASNTVTMRVTPNVVPSITISSN